MSGFIDFKSFLVGDFSGFWGSDGLPGSPVGALGLPWGPNVTPKRLQRGSGGGFGLDLESLGHPWRDIFHKKVELFSDPVLGWLLVSLFSRLFIDFV